MDYVLDNVVEWKNRLVKNSIGTWNEMTPQRWIRIIVIVGAYLLVRPYLVKGAENRQKRLLAKEAEELGLSEEPNANDWRGSKKGKKAEAPKVEEVAVDSGKAQARQRKAPEKKGKKLWEEQGGDDE